LAIGSEVEMLRLFGRLAIRSEKVKGTGGMVNHQIVRTDDPRKAVSINVHPDGDINIVDRQWREVYDGSDEQTVMQKIIEILTR
jgi:hypothetical protein